MTSRDEERYAYHALGTALRSDYRKLSLARECRTSWSAAWNDDRTIPDKRAHADGEWNALERSGARLVLREDPDFPPLLREIPWPPFALYIQGTLPAPGAPSVAIVGTRKATEDGARLARSFAAELGKAGVVIVSGLALGIDAAGHLGALDARGATTAVLPGGLDRIYPNTNEGLGHRILNGGGALVSEYPAGTPPLPHRFIERNRIVSGLSRGVLIIEAPERSGALATARFAADQNRDVFVLPGPSRHPNYRGSHQLIRRGAELVTDPSHILESLGVRDARDEMWDEADLGNEERVVLEALKGAAAPIGVDKIVELTNLKIHAVNCALTLLVLHNAVAEESGRYSIAR